MVQKSPNEERKEYNGTEGNRGRGDDNLSMFNSNTKIRSTLTLDTLEIVSVAVRMKHN